MMRHPFMRLVSFLLCFLLLMLPLTVYAKENIDHESENNGTLKRADAVTFGNMMVGRLSSESDVDCYKFKTKNTGDITVHFDHDGDGVYAYYWYATLLDTSNNVLQEGSLSGKEATTFSVTSVKPGTYYLKISKITGGNPLTNGFTKAAYRITVTTKCLNHPDLTDWVITKEISCSQEGERVQYCVACNTAVVVEPIKKAEHKYTDWSILKDEGYFKIGEKQRVCKSCGEVDKEYMVSTPTWITVIGVVVLILILIIIFKIRNSRARTTSRKSYSGSSSRSSGSSSRSSGSSSGSSDNNYDYTSSTSSYDDFDYYSRHADGSINIGGVTHDVYTYDAEGYTTPPYIEDAEGYKTYVDPGSVSSGFNWIDAGE